MRITRANIAQYANDRGLTPVQIDGIPEGFSFKQADITIGETTHQGYLVAFIPMMEWFNIPFALSARDEETLLDLYNNQKKYGAK